jgi:broad specificity phosphatase PhoE
VRHAQVHNPDDILYGRLPRFRLSDTGRQQAEVTAGILGNEPVVAIYTSPQLRARQTAAAIAGRHSGVAVRRSHLLAEVLTGWQGRRHSELEEINFDFYANPLNHEDEAIADLWHRITRFLRIVRRRHAGASVIAVTHGDIASLARGGLRGLPIEVSSIRRPHPYPGHGSITRLTFGPDLRDTYPVSVDYFDPNGDDLMWSRGWVRMEMLGVAAKSKAAPIPGAACSHESRGTNLSGRIPRD